MKNSEVKQKELCLNFGASYVPTDPDLKVGVALETLATPPLNALRHPPEGNTSGWYIWGGEELSESDDFFKPLHAKHLEECCPEIIKYLGLASGWRVLLAEGYEDVWFDESLLITTD